MTYFFFHYWNGKYNTTREKYLNLWKAPAAVLPDRFIYKVGRSADRMENIT